MRTFVINLNRAAERWRFQIEQAEQIGLPIERFEACNAEQISEAEFANAVDRWRRPLTRNEVACFRSHHEVWRVIAEQGETALVLEDDAVLAPWTPELIEALPLRHDAEVWNLEAGMAAKTIALYPEWEATIESSRVVRATRIHVDRGGAAGYCLTPAAAEMLVENRAGLPIASPDHYLHEYPGLRFYQVEPAPVAQLHQVAKRRGEAVQGAATSSLQAGRLSVLRRHGGDWRRASQFFWRRLLSEASLGAKRVACVGRSKRRLVETFDAA